MKAKLGIPVGVIGVALYLMALFSPYLGLLLLVGYVLLVEENPWLKKTAIKVVALTVLFSLIGLLLGLVPTLFSWIDSGIDIFKPSFSFTGLSVIAFINRAISFLRSTVSLIQNLLFLILAVMAGKQGTIPFGFIDKLINKTVE